MTSSRNLNHIMKLKIRFMKDELEKFPWLPEAKSEGLK